MSVTLETHVVSCEIEEETEVRPGSAIFFGMHAQIVCSSIGRLNQAGMDAQEMLAAQTMLLPCTESSSAIGSRERFQGRRRYPTVHCIRTTGTGYLDPDHRSSSTEPAVDSGIIAPGDNLTGTVEYNSARSGNRMEATRHTSNPVSDPRMLHGDISGRQACG